MSLRSKWVTLPQRVKWLFCPFCKQWFQPKKQNPIREGIECCGDSACSQANYRAKK